MTYQEECQRIHDLSLQALVRDGDIPFTLRPYRKFQQAATAIVIPGGLSDWGRTKMPMVAALLGLLEMDAVIMTTHAMFLHTDKFAEQFGLSLENISAFQEQYLRILNDQFGGTIKNLPRDLWSESVWTGLKGPGLGVMLLSTPYTRNPDKTISLIETGPSYYGELNIIPDWWDTPVN